MAFSQDQLKEMHRLCDPATGRGETEGGTLVGCTYRGKGNWDIYRDGEYVGTAWYS